MEVQAVHPEDGVGEGLRRPDRRRLAEAPVDAGELVGELLGQRQVPGRLDGRRQRQDVARLPVRRARLEIQGPLVDEVGVLEQHVHPVVAHRPEGGAGGRLHPQGLVEVPVDVPGPRPVQVADEGQVAGEAPGHVPQHHPLEPGRHPRERAHQLGIRRVVAQLEAQAPLHRVPQQLHRGVRRRTAGGPRVEGARGVGAGGLEGRHPVDPAGGRDPAGHRVDGGPGDRRRRSPVRRRLGPEHLRPLQTEAQLDALPGLEVVGDAEDRPAHGPAHRPVELVLAVGARPAAEALVGAEDTR